MKSLDADKKANKTSEAAPAEAEKPVEKIDFSKVKECVAVPKSKKLLQFTLDDGTGTDRTILSRIHAYY